MWLVVVFAIALILLVVSGGETDLFGFSDPLGTQNAVKKALEEDRKKRKR